jgi:cytochrome b
MDKVQVPLPEQPAASSILVWDLPVRLGHGLMAAGFVIAWLTAKG